MAGVQVRVLGLEAALRTATATEKAYVGKVPDIVGQVVVAGVHGIFSRGINPDTGAAWKPIKNRIGQPLLDRGVLRRSIHYERFGSRVAVGTNLIYAATHQFGDPHRVPKVAPLLVFQVMGVTVRAKQVSIPARKFLPETDAGLQRTAPGLAGMIEQYLQQQWK